MRQTGPAVGTYGSRSNPFAALLLVWALLFVLGCGELLPKKSTGEKLYRKHCADCHGLDATGNTIRYMGNPRANLTDGNWKYGGGDNLAIRETVSQGLVERHPSSLQRLDRKEIKDIADWILKLRGEVSR